MKCPALVLPHLVTHEALWHWYHQLAEGSCLHSGVQHTPVSQIRKPADCIHTLHTTHTLRLLAGYWSSNTLRIRDTRCAGKHDWAHRRGARWQRPGQDQKRRDRQHVPQALDARLSGHAAHRRESPTECPQNRCSQAAPCSHNTRITILLYTSSRPPAEWLTTPASLSTPFTYLARVSFALL